MTSIMIKFLETDNIQICFQCTDPTKKVVIDNNQTHNFNPTY